MLTDITVNVYQLILHLSVGRFQNDSDLGLNLSFVYQLPVVHVCRTFVSLTYSDFRANSEISLVLSQLYCSSKRQKAAIFSLANFDRFFTINHSIFGIYFTHWFAHKDFRS